MTRVAATSVLMILLLATLACGKYGRPRRIPPSQAPAPAATQPEPAPAAANDAEEAEENQP